MITSENGFGHSFFDAALYYLHDKRTPEQVAFDKAAKKRKKKLSGKADDDDTDDTGDTGDTDTTAQGGGGDDRRGYKLTSDRVAWTALRNMPDDIGVHTATRIMIETAANADRLKREAGVKTTGRKATAGAVFSFSMAWHPDKEPVPGKEAMLKAVDMALKYLKASHLQAMVVCHTDTKHPHVHVMVNRVNPENGISELKNTRKSLQAFREDYEKQTGLKLTRHRGDAPEAKPPRPARDLARAQGFEQRKSAAAQLRAYSADRKIGRKEEWAALAQKNREAKSAIYTEYGAQIKKAVADKNAAKESNKPLYREAYRQNREEAKQWAAREKTFFGRMINAAITSQMNGSSFAENLFFAGSRQAGLAGLQQARLDQVRRVENIHVETLRQRRSEALANQRAVFETGRASLMTSHAYEREYIKDQWAKMYDRPQGQRDPVPAQPAASQPPVQPAPKEPPFARASQAYTQPEQAMKVTPAAAAAASAKRSWTNAQPEKAARAAPAEEPPFKKADTPFYSKAEPPQKEPPFAKASATYTRPPEPPRTVSPEDIISKASQKPEPKTAPANEKPFSWSEKMDSMKEPDIKKTDTPFYSKAIPPEQPKPRAEAMTEKMAAAARSYPRDWKREAAAPPLYRHAAPPPKPIAGLFTRISDKLGLGKNPATERKENPFYSGPKAPES